MRVAILIYTYPKKPAGVIRKTPRGLTCRIRLRSLPISLYGDFYQKHVSSGGEFQNRPRGELPAHPGALFGYVYGKRVLQPDTEKSTLGLFVLREFTPAGNSRIAPEGNPLSPGALFSYVYGKRVLPPNAEKSTLGLLRWGVFIRSLPSGLAVVCC
jgi:hypothetical protein